MSTALRLLLLAALCGRTAGGRAAPPRGGENGTAAVGGSSLAQAPAAPGRYEGRRRLLSVFQNRQSHGDNVTAPLDKKPRSKLTVDNNTGMRKTQRAGQPTGASPATSVSSSNTHGKWEKSARGDPNHSHQFRDQPNPTSISAHESNRPRKILHHQLSPNFSKPPAIINRPPSGPRHQLNAFTKGSGSREKVCLSDRHKEREESEFFCDSDFAVNGFVHDVETLAGGTRLATLLLNSAGLYKTKRLYISPDGCFFRVNILSVDSPKCPKSCPEFKLGSRYIVMGRIYHKRTELPPDARQLLGGRLRAGDGLVGCGSYVRRFNRKKERKVLAAARAKCK